MELTSFKQDYIFNAEPSEVYTTIMNAENHSEFTGAACNIQDKVGSEFTAYDGYIQGKNIELIEGKLIKQLWRSNEDDWDRNHYSTISFELSHHPYGTLLDFTQIDIPKECAENIYKGWFDYYWEPLNMYLKKKSQLI